MEEEIQQLRDRLRRYPAERYPAQHATAQFHLGATYLQSGHERQALDALAVAESIFGELGMHLEHAKATMMYGVGQRVAGQAQEARGRFATAAERFRELDSTAGEGAALYNLGLVLVDAGALPAATEAFATAQELFGSARQHAWAGAAARERGTALVNGGQAAAAIPLLEEAMELSGEADPAGTGAAANVQGLAHLAVDDPASAVDSFRWALVWHPRGVRPAEHAMAKANLALAYEAVGSPAHARLAARQATTVPQAPEEVRVLSEQLLSRLPAGGPADLFQVLEEDGQREAWLRDEMLRWQDADPETRSREAAGWVREQARRGAEGVEYAQALLGVLLELPPSSYGCIVEALVQATGARPEEEAERFREVTSSAMARYPLPQWQRMAADFTAAAQRAGLEQQWR